MPNWRMLRLAVVFAAAAATGGCFQPLYGDHTISGGPGIQTALSGVGVQQINAANGTPEARIAVELRNALLFGINGGGTAAPQTHDLEYESRRRGCRSSSTPKPRGPTWKISASMRPTSWSK